MTCLNCNVFPAFCRGFPCDIVQHLNCISNQVALRCC